MHDARIDAAEERIRAFIGAALRNPAFRVDDPIFGTGALNSLFAMQLIFFIERTFGIQVGDADLEWSNFQTVRAIVHLVSRKSAVAAGAHES